MTGNYKRSNRVYASPRRTYGEDSRVMKTNYLPHGEHILSNLARKFIYPGFNKLDRSIHDFPVPGHITREIERILGRLKGKILSKKLDDILPSLGIIAGVFLLSGNLTGNTIGNVSQSDANLAGAFAIIIGIIGLFILRRK